MFDGGRASTTFGPLRCVFPVSVLVDLLRTTPESLRVLDSAFEGPSRAGDGAAWGSPSRLF